MKKFVHLTSELLTKTSRNVTRPVIRPVIVSSKDSLAVPATTVKVAPQIDRVYEDAEKLLNQSNGQLSVHTLFKDELDSITQILNKIVGTNASTTKEET